MSEWAHPAGRNATPSPHSHINRLLMMIALAIVLLAWGIGGGWVVNLNPAAASTVTAAGQPHTTTLTAGPAA